MQAHGQAPGKTDSPPQRYISFHSVHFSHSLSSLIRVDGSGSRLMGQEAQSVPAMIPCLNHNHNHNPNLLLYIDESDYDYDYD